MALLQIAEPGESTAPHQHRLAVGIDLGTTNSLIATVKSGSAEVLIGHDGDKLTASVVRYFANGSCEVGAKPRAEQADDPANTIVSVKRFMGRVWRMWPNTARFPIDLSTPPVWSKSKR